MKIIRACLTGTTHEFEARYDEVNIPHSDMKVKGCTVKEYRSLTIRNVYIKDICVKCGQEIKR